VAALAIANAALATLVVVLLLRGPEREIVTTVVPAGGPGSVDARVKDLIARLDREQLELEGKLSELKQVQALVVELQDKVHRCEQVTHKTTDRPRPAEPVDDQSPAAPADQGCDEVSCVLQNYSGTCCLKYRKTAPPIATGALVDSLDRTNISSGVAAVKAQVQACAKTSPAKGKVKVHVAVAPSGAVTSVTVETTPDDALGSCVAAAVQRARFAPTRLGGSFSYPFVF
jgi:TonB family protein